MRRRFPTLPHLVTAGALALGLAAALPPASAAPAAPAGKASSAPARTVLDGVFDALPGFELPEDAAARVRVRPDEFTAFDVDVSALAGRLAQAPSTRAARRGAEPLTVRLPDPDGTLRAFEVVEDPVMQAGLQAAHPGIRTFAGRQADDPARTVRLDVTPMGVHASVRGLAGRDTWYLDPVVTEPGTTEHVSYHRTALPEGPHLEETELVTSLLDEAGATPPTPAQAAQAARARTEPGAAVTRRTYGLALVTDPAYAAYFGSGGQPGDPAVVMAEKVTLMNRVNQVYNDDMAIHLQMVDGSEALNLDTAAKATEPGGPCGESPCFEAADLDPETGGCTGGLLTRNIFVTGQLVGADRFDIGHIMLGINGGGVAYLGVVGEDAKAGGCTGLPFPEGDFMAVDYVAHEMGHQFAGNHTFDGDQGACSGLNRSQGTSVEPGSGSSVMAYAGICGTDDLQPHTDPYFSQRTIDEFTAHVTQAPTSYREEQTITLGGFDTDGDTVNLRYQGRVTSIVRGTSTYNVVSVTQQMRTLTGAAVTVEGYDGSALSLNDGGFTVRWPDTTDHPRISVTDTTDAGGDPLTAFVGVPVEGGPGTNQGSTTTPTDNHAPTVTAPADKTIPVRTPFTLTGSGSDVDGDPLLYLWEQNDTGGTTGQSLTSSRTSGPLFRVFGTSADVSLEDSLLYDSPGQNEATGDPSRTFPDLAQVLAGTTNAATGSCPTVSGEEVPPAALDCFSELLPTAARTLRFRLTARDQFPTGGGTQYDDVALTVGSAGPFRVTSQPAVAEGQPQTTVVGGSAGTITWDVAGTAAAAYAPQVRITLSTDGGATFPVVLAQSTANDGSHEVTWPEQRTDRARVRVEAVDNYFFDVNRADFAIEPSLAVSAGSDSERVQHSDSFDEPVEVTLSAAQVDGDQLALAVSGLAGLGAQRVSATADGVRPGVARFEVDGPVTADIGEKVVTLAGSAPGGLQASDRLDVTVLPEDGTVDYTGPTTVQATQDPQPVALRATVAQADDGEPGDLTTARVAFVDRDNGQELCRVAPDAQGRAECAALLDVDGASTTYTVGTTLVGRFARDDRADDTVVTLVSGDAGAPSTTIRSGPGQDSFPRSATVVFELASDDSGATYDCTLDGVEVDCADGEARLGGLTQGTHRFSATARSAGGATDPTPATRTFGTPFSADRLTQESEGWKLRRGGRYYEKKFLRTDRRGEVLGFDVTRATKIVLVATKAPRHGRVRVLLDGEVLKKADLSRSRTKNGAVVTVTRSSSPLTGRLQVRTLRNRTVKIEGVGVISAAPARPARDAGV